MKLPSHKFSSALLSLIFIVSCMPGCATTAISPEEFKPMYGQPGTPRTSAQKQADEAFIREAAAAFSGSRERASTAAWRSGDQELNRNRPDMAMKFYNQSWLLNPDNYQPYWGFARILLERDQFDDAIVYAERALQLIDDDYQKVALLSDCGAVYTYKAQSLPADARDEKALWFARANQRFAESTRMDASYTLSWRSWARTLFLEERYVDAWDKVKKGRAAGTIYSPTFLQSLSEKMPEPQ